MLGTGGPTMTFQESIETFSGCLVPNSLLIGFKEKVNGNEFSIQGRRELLFKESFFLLMRHI
jgi:hypothetical protein